MEREARVRDVVESSRWLSIGSNRISYRNRYRRRYALTDATVTDDRSIGKMLEGSRYVDGVRVLLRYEVVVVYVLWSGVECEVGMQMRQC